MVLGSPSASFVGAIVFGSGADATSPARNSETQPHGTDVPELGESDQDGRSMYVQLFEEMLKDVLPKEGKLFLDEELDCFKAWHRLPYNAKYLFCRLCLRKDKWLRLDLLKYEAELGADGILQAVETLCHGFQKNEDDVDVKPKIDDLDCSPLDISPQFSFGDLVKTEEDVKPKIEDTENSVPHQAAGPEIIDPTFDEPDDEPPQAGRPIYNPPPSSNTSINSYRVTDSVFADDEEQADLRELLDCLTSSELEDLAKQLRLKPKGNSKKRLYLIEAILNGSASQTTLQFATANKKGKGRAGVTAQTKPLTQSKLPFKRTPENVQTQQDRLRGIVMKTLKKCIRLNSDVVELFRRANLVYFRGTQCTLEMLTPAILARARRRAYADYACVRTADIWPTRDALLAYEEALAVEAHVDALLDGTNGAFGSSHAGRSTASRTPAPDPGIRLKTPITPVKREKGADEQESERVRGARQVREIFNDVYPKWKVLVQARGEDDPRREGLERFDCGHILTRVVCKGAHALGILKCYSEELEVRKTLLSQQRWRRGRRGRWYERSALILMTHMKHKDGSLEEAMRVVVDALTDEDTHIVFRPMLVRRLKRLEKWLKIPPEQHHVCLGALQAAESEFVEGVRVRHRAGSLLLDQAGRVVNGSQPQKLSWRNRRDPDVKKVKVDETEKGGKSIWKGRDGEEVTVEILALQHYENKFGCKGFHSEGRIVTTLFGLLFWDVIFAPIPGAFETRYQSAPLDLVEDTFYHSRQSQADARLEDIMQGNAAEILEQTYDKCKDRMCVGVRWDMFEKADLLEIVKCLDRNALVAICRLLCEDYGGRTAGMPDLIVWNEEEKWAKFVEVKGPGDTLQENQKVWIDVMLQAGMPVQVCHVSEKGATKPKLKGVRGKSKTPKRKRAVAGEKRKREEDDDGWPVESEEEEVDYSQLDRHSEEEVEETVSPVKKKIKVGGHESNPVFVRDSESPSAQRVARMDHSSSEIFASPSRTSPTSSRRE